jgi:transposase InsO family protein
MALRPFDSASIGELRRLLDTFVEIYNHHRPHQSLAG